MRPQSKGVLDDGISCASGSQTLIVFSVLLVLKMVGVAFATANARRKAGVVVNPEDTESTPDRMWKRKMRRMCFVPSAPTKKRSGKHSGVSVCGAAVYADWWFCDGRMGVFWTVFCGAPVSHHHVSCAEAAMANGVFCAGTDHAA